MRSLCWNQLLLLLGYNFSDAFLLVSSPRTISHDEFGRSIGIQHTNKNPPHCASLICSAYQDIHTFGFSCEQEWENYYHQQQEQAVVEWHSSIPLQVIADKIPSNANCILVGTGLSHLPTVLRNTKHAKLTLQDSSRTCLEQLRHRYKHNNAISYLLGDATQLSLLLTSQNKTNAEFDVVIDKGLMDAIFCGEGWNRPIAQLLKEASCLLQERCGFYLLVSYRLPTSTREYLQDVGSEVGLAWEFNVDGSNDRVGISIARRTSL